jgi:hypothetical protein
LRKGQSGLPLGKSTLPRGCSHLPRGKTGLPDGDALESKTVKMQQELEALQAKLTEKDKKLEE